MLERIVPTLPPFIPSRLQGRAGSPTPTTPTSQHQPLSMTPLHTPLTSFAATPLPSASIPVMPHTVVAQPLIVAGTVTTAAKQVRLLPISYDVVSGHMTLFPLRHL